MNFSTVEERLWPWPRSEYKSFSKSTTADCSSESGRRSALGVGVVVDVTEGVVVRKVAECDPLKFARDRSAKRSMDVFIVVLDSCCFYTSAWYIRAKKMSL